jgi:hypothetical protein
MAAAYLSKVSAISRMICALPAATPQGAWIMSRAFSAMLTVSPAMAISEAADMATPSISTVTAALWRWMAL